LNICKLLKCRNVKDNPENKKGYFCSELVACIYKRMNVIEDNTASTKFYPGTFETGYKKIQFINGAFLEDEILIDFYL